MSYIWFTLSLKRTTLASDEGMPDLLMTWVLGLRHATSLQSHMDVSVRPPTMLNCVYIHLLHYEPLEGRSCNFYFFLPTPYHSARHMTRVGYCFLACSIKPLGHSVLWGGKREKARREGRKLERQCVCVCVRACSVAQSCPTLCDPMDCSLPGSSVHGIFPARILEWVAISSSRASSRPGDRTFVSCIGRRGFFTTEPLGKPYRNACCCSVAKSCPTFWDPMDCSMPGFPLEEGMANHTSILAVRTP